VLSQRTGTILKSIVNWYIEHGVPVSSQVLVHDYDLGVSSATVRNEMAFLEQEGYIFRPHTSSGSVPSDKGYRFYVGSLEECSLPVSEQRMISHLFHQVEGRMDEWLSLGANVVSRLAQNTTVITVPRQSESQLRHVELVSIQDNLVLMVVVLRGARIKQQLVNLDHSVAQIELSVLSDKLNQQYAGESVARIKEAGNVMGDLEKQMTENLIKIMQQEGEEEFTQTYLEGLHFMLNQPEFTHTYLECLHFMLNQPEFTHSQRTSAVMEMLEHPAMLRAILPQIQENGQVMVVIGSENKAEVAHDCSLVLSRYGLKDASGAIIVVGPTRMAYSRVISSVNYLSLLLSHLVAELYGVKTRFENEPENNN